MKKILLTLCGFCIAVSFTGCIEIFETLDLEKKGSGHFSQKVDMSGAMSMINSMKAMSEPSSEGDNKESQEPAQNSDPGKDIVSKWESIKSIEGISNVHITTDSINYIYTISYDFANENALNEAMRGEQKDGAEPSKFYAIGKSSITRNNVNITDDMFGDEEDESSTEMVKAMLSEMKYHITVTVPGKIKSVSNKYAEIAGDKKTVTLQTTFGEVTEKKKSLGMEIDYK